MTDRNALLPKLLEGASKEGARAKALYGAWWNAWFDVEVVDGTYDRIDDSACLTAFRVWYETLLARAWANEVSEKGGIP